MIVIYDVVALHYVDHLLLPFTTFILRTTTVAFFCTFIPLLIWAAGRLLAFVDIYGGLLVEFSPMILRLLRCSHPTRLFVDFVDYVAGAYIYDWFTHVVTTLPTRYVYFVVLPRSLRLHLIRCIYGGCSHVVTTLHYTPHLPFTLPTAHHIHSLLRFC